MFLCKTPYRVSFFGGGSDYPKWFNSYSGEVIGSSINKHFHLITKKFSFETAFHNYKFKIVWGDVSHYRKLKEVGNLSFRKILFYFFSKHSFSARKYCFDFTCFSDVSSGSGMGSSSAFTVTLLNSLYMTYGIKKSKVELIQESVFVEQFVLGEAVGCQDQVLTCFGGLNMVKFYRDNSFKVLTLKKGSVTDLFNSKLRLFNTGCVRLSSNIAASYLKNVDSNKIKVSEYRVLLKKFLYSLCSSYGSNDTLLNSFGSLLHKSWLIKKSLTTSITNPHIDSMYETACKDINVLGGKLLGAGGGGFLLLLSKVTGSERLSRELNTYKELPFSFEDGGASCTKI